MIVAASILSADFSQLAAEIKAVDAAGADWIHLDVMDGVFVPNLTFGAPVIKKLRPHTKKLFDAHLMIQHPELLLDDFLQAGADLVTVHYEATEPSQIKEIIRRIHAVGKKAGLSICPKTGTEVLLPFLDQLELVLVMSVEPGFGGQQFMPEMLSKVHQLVDLRKKEPKKLKFLIQIDGGINEKTIKPAAEAGVEAVVAGSFIFGKKDYAAQVAILK